MEILLICFVSFSASYPKCGRYFAPLTFNLCLHLRGFANAPTKIQRVEPAESSCFYYFASEDYALHSAASIINSKGEHTANSVSLPSPPNGYCF